MRRVSMVLTQLTPSPDIALAVDLVTVKRQRRLSIEESPLDDLWEIWINAATELFQEQTGRQCITRPFHWHLDSFPTYDRYLQLPRPPLQAVQAVEYLDGTGAWVELDSDLYVVDAPIGPHAGPGRIVLKDGAMWPQTVMQDRCVRISFTAGYGDAAADVPPLVRAALLYLVGHFHRYGEEVVGGQEAAALQTLPLGATTMIRAFRNTALMTQAPWEVPWRD